ncbi:hypothetical protein QBC33DRAFT_525683 [Phialemonium atrogriseum]|uniref:Uncharacterized protein n=1 Tax=Phialemonium atrogriseum TaxID=1093897 RepID=A0AAJ0C5X6_9PEZI|nr:uncharacterized protein QBC33DRAFT_525683 [Phialemonium atrogriseum]KAK1770768.1 hypothetical protein QBC33DRAFT_525683 [Phialemonium atrogriseum]
MTWGQPWMDMPGKADGKAVRIAIDEIGIVTSLCTKFQESGIQCPVLTMFETRPTKIRHGFSLWRSEKRLLIPCEFAETGVRGEELISLNLDMRDIKSIGASTQHAQDFRAKVKSLLSDLRNLSEARAAENPIDISVGNQNLFASTATQTAPSQPGDLTAYHKQPCRIVAPPRQCPGVSGKVGCCSAVPPTSTRHVLPNYRR